MTIVMLLIAGALGTLARYGLDLAAARWLSPRLPEVAGPLSPSLGVLLANVLGCAGFALAFGLFERFGAMQTVATEVAVGNPHTWRIAVLVGFFGAFTTFSTYAFSVLTLARQDQWGWVLGVLMLHNVLGLAAAAGVYALAKP